MQETVPSKLGQCEGCPEGTTRVYAVQHTYQDQTGMGGPDQTVTHWVCPDHM